MPGPRNVFVCTNKRRCPLSCGLRGAASAIADHLASRVQGSPALGDGQTRVVATKCLGRCPLGPVLGIMPDNVWYTYETTADIDEVVEEHLENGRIVERLLVDSGAARPAARSA